MGLILVAMDGSEGAGRAIDYAAHRAKADRADPLIVNIVGGCGLLETIYKALTQDQSVRLRELLDPVSARMLTAGRDRAEGRCRSGLARGEIAQTIVEIARAKKADAIVVGDHGLGRVAEGLLGGVARKLAVLCPVPLTVVP